MDGPLMASATNATIAAGSAELPRRRGVVIDVFARLVGPAALTAAGMIGAGAVATRLLAGAWFGFDLLWVALYVVPMVVITLDSASRVGVLSGGRGMFEMIRTEIGAWLAWGIFLPTVLVNVIVNMSQMSAMVEGSYGMMGALPPAGVNSGVGLAVVTVVLTAVTVCAAVLGGYKRMEKIMTALLVVILICFIAVAVKGLLDWHTWSSLASGLIPRVPPALPVSGDTRVRDGFTQILAIAGQALPPSVFLEYGYLASNAG